MEEGIGCDEHWILYLSVELLHCTPETNILCMLTDWNLKKNLKSSTGENLGGSVLKHLPSA